MNQRQTHTFATLDVPRQLYEYVKDALLAAGYEHALERGNPDGPIDMHGIALTPMSAEEEKQL